ncbi:hypothetical protein BHU72_10795 [Desulfuribacillus stibiiarsenatis]|uniref:DUF817 domain-containing protein n=2 Tax=Desulfuribacillus stibiiarsenatis TaxID=1390249 RepID=A0A1E5L2J3_9FIRM|nr:hypothetical protein BHU72_10795 [Desulfuribacillus stibiiarsenatis]
MSCLFPVAIFIALAISKMIAMPGLHRYDFLLIVCILMQVVMYKTGLETKDELKVISLFHIIGLGLELFKVHMGSWSYPEVAWTKIYGVPLYSGFMYASVASYLCQAWRRFDLTLVHWPRYSLSVPLAIAIYMNFFSHHYIYDFRWVLSGLLFLVFFKTVVHFKVGKKIYQMPIFLSFVLVGFFIWIAENITTFYGAWTYPNQNETWQLVHLGKISSWFLLVIISVIIVADLKHVKQKITKQE